jgi:hypothetical protein
VKTVIAMLLAALLVPATAAAADTWQPVTIAGAPSTVTFNSITTTDLPAIGGAPEQEVVIAVGEDAVTDATTNQPTTAAVIYRFAGGQWSQDAIMLPAGTPAGAATRLTSVSTAGGVAWAVGSAGSGPLALRLDSTGLASGAAATWTAISGGGTAALRSVSLVPATGGASGFVSGADGSVYPADDNSTGSTIGTALTLPPNSGVNDVAALAPGAGFAAGKQPTSTAASFTDLKSGTGQPAPMPSYSLSQNVYCKPDIRAISAISSTEGLAIDDGCLWTLSGGAWTQTDTGFGSYGIALADVAVAPGGLAAVAGQIGNYGRVWRQTDSGWVLDAVGGAPLRSIAIGDADDMWAAGEHGAITHYTPAPPPPPPIDTGGGSGSTDTSGGDSVVVDNSSPAPSGDAPIDQSTPTDSTTTSTPPATTAPSIVVAQPTPTTAPKKKRKKRLRKRLMTDVSAAKVKDGLVLNFNLTAPAKVTVIATKGKKVVGKANAGTLPKGRNKLVLHYHGTKPTDIKIVVRPAKKAGSGVRKGTRK